MRFAISRAVLLLGAACVLAPVAAAAQVVDLDSQTSDVRVFEGTLDGEPAEYRVRVPAGSVMTIDVLAQGDLDPTVAVRDANTGEVLAEDDDGGDEGLNSRVRVRGGDTGRAIVIAVDSFDASWVGEGESYSGRFDLRLTTSAFVATRPVTYGARETGEVEDGEGNTYAFTAAAGDRVEIALIADGDASLDPYLELQDDSGEIIASNDDYNGLNSYIDHTFEEAGTYIIVAKGFSSSTGDYRLRIRDRRAPIAQLPLQVIGIDDEASGELQSNFGIETMESTHVDYQLSEAAKAAIRRGDGEVTIRMNAVEGGDPDFGGSLDPFVALGFDTPLGFAVVDQDDDGSGTLNAMLPVDLGLIADRPELLDALRIRVQPYGGSSGGYTLTITDGMEARPEGYDYTLDGLPPTVPPPPPISIVPAS